MSGMTLWDGPERRQMHCLRQRVALMSRQELESALLTDDLTGLGNHRAWEERLPQEGETVIMVDVDSLKAVNDLYGHHVGDELLRNVASFLQYLATTQGGVAFRLSGDEFVLIVPPANDVWPTNRATFLLQRFPERHICWADSNGTSWVMTGLTVTYGVGSTLAEADAALLENKGLRQAAGLRAPRGERPAGLKVMRVEEYDG